MDFETYVYLEDNFSSCSHNIVWDEWGAADEAEFLFRDTAARLRLVDQESLYKAEIAEMDTWFDCQFLSEEFPKLLTCLVDD